MRILFFALCLALAGCSTQLIPNEIENNKILGVMPMQYGRASYQVVQPMTSTRENTFRQARRWAAFHFSNPAQAFAVSDGFIGDIITGGSIEQLYYKTKSGPQLLPGATYVASIECTDQDYRITLTNVRINLLVDGYRAELRRKGTSKANQRKVLEAIDEKLRAVLESANTFIQAEVK